MATQSTDSRTFNDLVSMTFENVQAGVQDNIYESNPTFAKLNEAGNIEKFNGGRRLDELIATDENNTVKSYSAGGTFDTSEQEQTSRAQYDVRFVGGTVAWNREDERLNSGEAAIDNFVTERIMLGTKQMKQELNKQLLRVGAKAASGDIDGIAQAITSSPSTSGAYGGFDGSTDTFWQNQVETSAGTATRTSIITELLNLSVNCQLQASGAPDFYLADPTTWQILASGMQDAVRVADKASANLGFDSIQYRGVPIFFDAMVPDAVNGINFGTALTSGTVYALNSNAMKLKVDAQSDIAMLDLQVPTTNPTRRVRPIVWYGNLITKERRALGVLDTINLATIA